VDAPATEAHPDAHRIKSQARRQFEDWAQNYDRSLLNRFLFQPCYLMLAEEIWRWHDRHRRPFRLLDVGCGTGTLAGLLSGTELPLRAVGLDYSPAMCAEAARKAAGLLLKVEASTHGDDGVGHGASDRPGFVAGDSEHLPFADASFDIVTCSNSFHHYPHQRTVVREMRRVLRPGGLLLVLDGFRDNVVGWFVFDVIIAGVEKDVHHAPWPVMHRYFVEAGLGNVRRRKFNFWFPVLATIGEAP